MVTEVHKTGHVSEVKKLRTIFASHGLQAVLVSSNGPSLVSAEFKQLLKKSGIKLQHPSTHPQMAVQIMQCTCLRKESRRWRRGVWGQSFPGSINPSDHNPRLTHELENQDSARFSASFTWDKVGGKQATHKEYHDKHAQDLVFTESNPVFRHYRNFWAVLQELRGMQMFPFYRAVQTGPFQGLFQEPREYLLRGRY